MAAGMPQEGAPRDMVADWGRRLGKAGGRGDLSLSAWTAVCVDGGVPEQDGEFRRRAAMKLDAEFSSGGMLAVMRGPFSGRSRCRQVCGVTDL